MLARRGRRLSESPAVLFCRPSVLFALLLALSITSLLCGKTHNPSHTHTHTHTHTKRHTHTWSEEYRLSPISPGMWLSTADTQTALWARHGKVREEGRKSARGKIQAYRVDGPVFPNCKKNPKKTRFCRFAVMHNYTAANVIISLTMQRKCIISGPSAGWHEGYCWGFKEGVVHSALHKKKTKHIFSLSSCTTEPHRNILFVSLYFCCGKKKRKKKKRKPAAACVIPENVAIIQQPTSFHWKHYLLKKKKKL